MAERAQVSRLASSLVGLGLAKGDRVGLILGNEPRGLVSLFGPLRAGMALVPMNPKLHPSEHAYMLGHCGARALVVSRPYLEGQPGVPRASLPAGLVLIGIDAHDLRDRDVLDFDRLLEVAEADRPTRTSMPTISPGSSTPQARPGGPRAPC